MVRQHQTTDEGAARLGEVALVDGSSPIGQSGYTMFTTLLDENAACHLAWGSGIPEGIKGGHDQTEEELRDRGMNVSNVHVDFMIGGPELEVRGVRRDGSEISLLRNTTWQV
jgi:aminopeptidase